jgi:hypothetical protein
MCTRRGNREQGTGNREQGTGIAAAARSDESIGAENTATAFPASSAAVLRIPQYHRTLSCNKKVPMETMFSIYSACIFLLKVVNLT